VLAADTGLTREYSETIGFVLSSLLCSTINLEELKQWCYQTISDLGVNEAHAYLFDLSDHSGTFVGIYRPLGFVSSWQRSAEESARCMALP